MMSSGVILGVEFQLSGGESQMNELIWYSWLGGAIIGTIIGANSILEEHCKAGPRNVVITGRCMPTHDESPPPRESAKSRRLPASTSCPSRFACFSMNAEAAELAICLKRSIPALFVGWGDYCIRADMPVFSSKICPDADQFRYNQMERLWALKKCLDP